MTDILTTDSNGALGWRSLNGRKEEERSTRNIALLLGRARLFSGEKRNSISVSERLKNSLKASGSRRKDSCVD